MNEPAFWKLIGHIESAALLDGDEETALEPLQEALSGFAPRELEGFEEILAQKLFALDGQRYADAAGESGRSADGFLYARCFVVARGEAFYASVLADPSKMPDSEEAWCEGLLSLASEAYEATGSEWAFTASVSYETGSNHKLW